MTLQTSSGVLAIVGRKGQLRIRTKAGAAHSDPKPKSSNIRRRKASPRAAAVVSEL
ncbi:hypothetical protein ACFXMT_46630 [Streptomyces mirabilis]|uniref:hypothetical protein n=1 Tax=Streptomyces mirabilis TaxID=68239 RepID=UPI003682254B